MLKRIFDIVIVAMLLFFCMPLILFIAMLIRLNIGKPVFFTQQRPGLHGIPFKLIKFRTMLDKYASNGEPLPDSQRLTLLGKFLRSSSLDELPELWNVLKGEMSLVGPRPLLMEYLSLYTPMQSRRHDVLPGITGWAQVNGRNAIAWDDKFKLDVWYIAHQSWWLDIKILFLTIKKVFLREGISAQGEATATKFEGS